AAGALFKKAVEAAGYGISDARAELEREAFSTVLGWYIKQLHSPELRRRLAPLAKLDGEKPLDKALLAALASMIVDPMLDAAKKEAKARLLAEARELLDTVRGAGAVVRTGPTPSADDTSVTLPSEVLAALEWASTADAAEANMREVELRELLAAAWANARSVAIAEGLANQARLYR